jgi:hypothetical protein
MTDDQRPADTNVPSSADTNEPVEGLDETNNDRANDTAADDGEGDETGDDTEAESTMAAPTPPPSRAARVTKTASDSDALTGKFLKITGLKKSDIDATSADGRTFVTTEGKYALTADNKNVVRLFGPNIQGQVAEAAPVIDDSDDD